MIDSVYEFENWLIGGLAISSEFGLHLFIFLSVRKLFKSVLTMYLVCIKFIG